MPSIGTLNCYAATIVFSLVSVGSLLEGIRKIATRKALRAGPDHGENRIGAASNCRQEERSVGFGVAFQERLPQNTV